MRLRIIHIIICSALLLLSCDEYFIIIDCSDCLATDPSEVNVFLDLESEYKTIVNIYQGNIEDNILMSSFPTTTSAMEVKVTVNKIYTFKIEYTDLSGITYTVINRAYPRVKLDLEQCSNFPCYYVYDNKLNMHLKY